MIVIALLLASAGVADIVRERIRHRRAPLIAMIVGVALVAAFSAVTGVPWWWALISAALLVGWVSAWRDESPNYTAWVLAAITAAAIVALTLPETQRAIDSSVLAWYDSLPIGALEHVPFETFALGTGGVLFLVETANVVVRFVLSTARRADRDTDGERRGASNRRRDTPSFFELAPSERAEHAPRETNTLKGGRIIGPLERLVILVLALAGEFTAIAAVVAAKGIVRFPEISRNDDSGTKSEEFLVGSLASWAAVLVVVVALRTN